MYGLGNAFILKRYMPGGSDFSIFFLTFCAVIMFNLSSFCIVHVICGLYQIDLSVAVRDRLGCEEDIISVL